MKLKLNNEKLPVSVSIESYSGKVVCVLDDLIFLLSTIKLDNFRLLFRSFPF